MSDPTPESNRATRPSSDGAQAATLTGQHRAFDEAAAKLVAAWDTDLDAQTPSEGVPVSPQAEAPPQTRAPATSAWLELQDAAPPRSHSSSKALLLGGVTCAALVIGWLAMSGDESTPEPEQPSGSASAVAEPAPSPATTPAQPEPEPEPPPRFSLTVRTVPPDAELRVDGEEVVNPYVGQHETAHSMKVTATAEGHEPAEREVELDEDVHLTLTLTPREKPEARANARKRARKRAATKRRRARARREKQARRQRAARRAKRQRAKDQAPGFIRNNPYD